MARGQSDARQGRRAADVQAPHGQGELRQDRRPHRADSALPAAGDPRRGVRRLQGLRRRRHPGRGRRVVPHQDRRALGARRGAAAAGEVAAAAARQVARARRHRNALPAALPRPDRERGEPQRLSHTRAHRPLPARLPRCARLPRGRDADDAADPRRGHGAPLPHASQRARSRHVPAHRAGAVPEASHRRRLRAGVRDQPQLPQRGPVDAAQPRIHDARAIPRVRRLP